MGPIHRAAQKENLTFRHIAGGCYHRGRCEQLHLRATVRELRRRGVDTRGLSIRQALRVATGYPAGLRGDRDADEGRGGERVLEMGGHSGEWSGGMRRRDKGRRELGGRVGKGMSRRSASRGNMGERYHDPSGGMGVGTSQLRAMVNEYATHGGKDVRENHNHGSDEGSGYSDRDDGDEDTYSVD